MKLTRFAFLALGIFWIGSVAQASEIVLFKIEDSNNRGKPIREQYADTDISVITNSSGAIDAIRISQTGTDLMKRSVANLTPGKSIAQSIVRVESLSFNPQTGGTIRILVGGKPLPGIDILRYNGTWGAFKRGDRFVKIHVPLTRNLLGIPNGVGNGDIMMDLAARTDFNHAVAKVNADAHSKTGTKHPNPAEYNGSGKVVNETVVAKSKAAAASPAAANPAL